MERVMTAVKDQASRKGDQHGFHDHDVEEQPDNIDGDELPILLVPAAGSQPPKGPETVPDEAIGDCKGEGDGLRRNLVPAERMHKEFPGASCNKHAGKA